MDGKIHYTHLCALIVNKQFLTIFEFQLSFYIFEQRYELTTLTLNISFIVVMEILKLCNNFSNFKKLPASFERASF